MTADLWAAWAEEATRLFGVSLSAVQIERFRRYEEILQAWNRHTNLTAIREPADIRQRHFLDAFSCAGPLQRFTPDLAGRQLVDIGTGAGFPGLPLKIIFPELTITLVDSVRKKTDFLHAAAGELALKGVNIVHARAEELGRSVEYRERFEWAVARSVAHLNVLGEYLLPLVKVGGFMLAQKGERAAEEVKEAAGSLDLLGGELGEIIPYHLPGREFTHLNVVIAKTRPTPPKYPRRPGLPAKRPIEN